MPGAVAGDPLVLPLADEPFVEAWQNYLRASHQGDCVTALREPFVQWNFPVQQGLSAQTEYVDVTRRFAPVGNSSLASGPEFRDPAGVTLRLQESLAGRIPIVAFSDREDFEYAWRALTQRNEPVPIPGGMGAAMIAGYNNVARIQQAQADYLKRHSARQWPEALRELLQQKARYQDKFILISPGEYSGVPAAQLNLDDHQWRELSVEIRIHHELTHYVTQRLCGSMQNHLLDELIADYAGMTGANRDYHADWFLRCMGVDEKGSYQLGSRMQHYTADIVPGSEAFDILVRLISTAARNLEKLNVVLRRQADSAVQMVVLALACFSLAELADEGSVAGVVEQLDQLKHNMEIKDYG